MYFMINNEINQKRKCQLFGTTGKPTSESLLFSVVHLGSEKVPLGVRGLNLHDIVLSTVDHRIKPRLDIGGLLVPVVLVALDEQNTKVVAVSSTGSVVGDFSRREIPGRVRCLHGSDIVLPAVNRRLELGTQLVLLLIEVILAARDREQPDVAATHRLRAHFESMRRFRVIPITAGDEEEKSEKRDREHCLSDFHQNLLLGLGMCHQANIARLLSRYKHSISISISQAQTKNQHSCCFSGLNLMCSRIKKFSSPKMRNRQFVFTPKIEYQLVAERSEAD